MNSKSNPAVTPVAARQVRRLLAVVICSAAIGTATLWGQSSKNDADVGSSVCSRAGQAMTAGDWARARDLYDRCLHSTPPTFEVLSNLGTAESHLGLMEDAIQSYEKAAELAPGNPQIEFNLALTYIKAGNCSAAVSHLLRLREAPQDPRSQELLAFCYYHMGHYPLAAREAERVQAIHPGDPANALILGSAYMRLGQYKKALPLITLALKAAGSAEGHMIMGETLLGLRHYHRAMNELAQAARLQSDLTGLHTAMGMGKVNLGDRTGAMAEFRLALKQNPHDFEANYYMGLLTRLNGDIPDAKGYLRMAEQLRPGNPEAMFEFAAIDVSERNYSKARQLLLKVIAEEPDQREAHFLLARCDQNTGQYDEAKKERAIFEKLQSEHQGTVAPPGANVLKSDANISVPK